MSTTVTPIVNRPNLLQAFRAVHAIAEAGFTVAVDQLDRYRYLQQYFPLSFTADGNGPSFEVCIDHVSPLVRIGAISRPLLFARALAGAYWAEGPRPLKFSFAGFMTPERKAAVSKWAARNGYRMPGRVRRGSPGLAIMPSKRGRGWPEKAWDPDYVQMLQRSAFTLCPDGDFVWTYRFFEAALAGSIPVIESYCDLYDGFAFVTMVENPRVVSNVERAVEHNRRLAFMRLTVPGEELAAEVRRLALR